MKTMSSFYRYGQLGDGVCSRGYNASSFRGTMPFKSKAQRRKFAQLLVEGKISDQTFEEWNRETGRKVLPERVKQSATAGRKTAAKKATSRASSRKKR